MTTGHKMQTCFLLSCAVAILHFSGVVHAQGSTSSRLKYKVLSEDRIEISWKAPKGQYQGFKLLITPKSGGKPNQLTLKRSVTRAIIQGLDPDQSYLVQVVTYNGVEESRPTRGQFRIRDLDKDRKETVPKKYTAEDAETAKDQNKPEAEGQASTPVPGW